MLQDRPASGSPTGDRLRQPDVPFTGPTPSKRTGSVREGEETTTLFQQSYAKVLHLRSLPIPTGDMSLTSTVSRYSVSAFPNRLFGSKNRMITSQQSDFGRHKGLFSA